MFNKEELKSKLEYIVNQVKGCELKKIFISKPTPTQITLFLSAGENIICNYNINTRKTTINLTDVYVRNIYQLSYLHDVCHEWFKQNVNTDVA